MILQVEFGAASGRSGEVEFEAEAMEVLKLKHVGRELGG